MEEQTLLIILYDYYKELLNDHQKVIFEDYYFNNLSLREISDNHNLSHNAIHKTLTKVKEALLDYETKLKLLSKSDQIKAKIKDEETLRIIEEIL